MKNRWLCSIIATCSEVWLETYENETYMALQSKLTSTFTEVGLGICK